MSNFIKIGTAVIDADKIICVYVGTGVSIKLPDCIITAESNGNIKIYQNGRGELPIGSIRDFDLQKFHDWLYRVLQDDPDTPNEFPITQKKGVGNE